jgi:chemotaxis protein MotA
MDKGTAIGLFVGIVGLMGGAVVESGGIEILFALLNIPAFMIVVFGTFGATLVAFPLERVLSLPKILGVAFRQPAAEGRQVVHTFVKLAERARREGLLALESDANELKDLFMKKGLLLVVDGTDPELVREILEIEMDAMAARHSLGAQPFEKAGGFAPTMGIIGTVMGLVHVLENLSRPATLGPAISSAFIATLYGVGSANVIFLPVANKLKYLSSVEQELRMMTVEGILAIQAGDNPRIVESKLMSYVSPELRTADGEAEAGAASASTEPAAAAA